VVLALAVTVPLAWKWELGVVRVAVVMGVLAAIAFAVLAVGFGIEGVIGGLAIALTAVVTGTGVLAARFYRDPERHAPPERDVLVSPADGEVIYVRQARAGVVPMSTKQGRDYTLDELSGTPLPYGDAVVVGIAMSFLDVHVNRAPIAGEVTLLRHVPGLFGSLKHFEMSLKNARTTTVIAGRGIDVAVVQIASRLVRQIASYVGEDQRVAIGERIGVIRLGSQVDVVAPSDRVDVVVRPGDRVRAGESIVARLRQ
jgi:phosphatidylserine decarboxylase